MTTRERFHRFLRRQHLASGRPLSVGSRHIYILPTRYGWFFGILLILMLLASLNYDNNPAYLLTFLLFSLGSNGMFFTWRSLFRLRIRLLPTQPVFAGDNAQLAITLDGDNRYSLMLQLGEQMLIEDIGGEPRRTVIEVRSHKRGWLNPGELIISSRFPLGLFRAWSIMDVDEDILVYPRPAAARNLPKELLSSLSGGDETRPGEEELYGLREFRPGDPLSHTDWKGLARGRGLMTKQFHDPAQEQPLLIEWQQFAPRDVEQRLSIMTRLVIEAEHAQRLYGLSLPGEAIAPGLGKRHYRRCLEALALFGMSST